MRERDRLAIKAYREELEAAERGEREKRERPIRDAEAQLRETHRKLHAVIIERLLGRVRDPDRIPVDPAVANVRMSRADADKFNLAEFRKYREEHPEIHWTEELVVNQIGAYFAVNGLHIISANMLGSLIERYREAGLLPDPPTPEPEPIPEQVQQPQPATEPELIDGFDLESGEPRKWAQRELDRLSSTAYRKALKLTKSDLAVINVGPGARWARQ